MCNNVEIYHGGWRTSACETWRFYRGGWRKQVPRGSGAWNEGGEREAACGTKEGILGEIEAGVHRSKPGRCVKMACRGGMCLHWTKFGS